MTHAHHPGPVVLTPSGQPVVLKKLSFLGSGDGATFDEDWLQNTLFTNPDVLPILDIDSAYKGCIPVCRELNTRAGPLDLLYVTPSGRLVVVETKLWRNAEARRTVISQTLDYASQLAKWSFDDLTREVCRARKEPAGALIDLVRRSHPEINERDFADQISLTLRTGRFLLLIVGDGIREGVHALTDFLDRYAMLEFSFGLIEIGVYEHPAVGRLIFPRPLAKTAIVKRSVITIDRELIEQGVVLRDTGPDQEAPEDIDQEVVKRNAFYLAFWSRFLGNLEIQDTTQPKAKESKWENIYSTCRLQAL